MSCSKKRERSKKILRMITFVILITMRWTTIVVVILHRYTQTRNEKNLRQKPVTLKSILF